MCLPNAVNLGAPAKVGHMYVSWTCHLAIGAHLPHILTNPSIHLTSLREPRHPRNPNSIVRMPTPLKIYDQTLRP